MRLLFIKPKEIGDTLILTPTLRAAKQAYPNTEIWVLVRRGCEGILAGCPEVDRVVTISGVEKKERTLADLGKDLATLIQLRGVRFDFVFELGDTHRGRLFGVLTRAGQRYSVRMNGAMGWLERRRFAAASTYDALDRHRVEKDYHSVAEFLKLIEPIPPMVFDRNRAQPWPEGGELTDFAFVQIGSRKEVNRWPRASWREVIGHLLTRFHHVVVSGGSAANEVADAEWLRQELGPRVVCTLGQTSWSQVAGLLYQARLYVGLNTAAMHLAAACGCPTVALFGRTSEEHWYPWQARYRIVAAQSFADVADARRRQQLTRSRQMNDISPAKVIEACDALLQESPLAMPAAGR